ncbi:MAG TPA: hypothetical protein VN452_02540 [Longilinea sp.]|nr:hypothetical protein [Longilinea sp.]
MKLKSEQMERILWAVAISLALLLRLVKLGGVPLSTLEALNALPVFNWLQNGLIPAGSQAAYTLFSGLIFFLFGSTNFSARLIPALAGSLLVVAPLFYRKQLGQWPALIAAFGLAIDPALVAISRQADGSIWAITFTLFAFGLILNRQFIWSGICFGLALLGGPNLWMGWLGLGVAIFASIRMHLFGAADGGQDGQPYQFIVPRVISAAVITLLAAGTFFLFAPFGLSMAAGSLPEFLRGWTQTGSFSVQTAAIALLSYALLPFILGTIQAIASWLHKDLLDQFLTIWLVISLLLWFACRGRIMGYAGWVMIPLWALAARQIAVWLRKPEFDARFTAAMATVVFVLIFFIILNAVGILHPAGWSAETNLQIVKIVVALVLLGLAIVLVGWGWNWSAARQGVQWASGAALLLILISMSLRAAGLGVKPEAELWRSGAYFVDADLLEKTLHDLSINKSGQVNNLQVSVVGIQSPTLKWLLRDFISVQYSDSISMLETPDIILTNDQTQPGQTSTYRGQDFVLSVQPAWNQMIGSNWSNWLVFREAPEETSKIILWASTDLFPGEPAVLSNP